MIRLRKSSKADTRSAREKVSKETLLKESNQHIGDVGDALHWMMERLEAIRYKHDWTKVKYIDEFFADFSATQAGLQGDFKQMHWFKDLHLLERHHLNDRVPDDVNLFDVLERVADVTTAGMARTGNIYPESISPEMLVKAYNNTIELLAEQIVVD